MKSRFFCTKQLNVRFQIKCMIFMCIGIQNHFDAFKQRQKIIIIVGVALVAWLM